MNVVVDADRLIKLTKTRIKEEVCRAFRVFISGKVCREVLQNAKEHPECGGGIPGVPYITPAVFDFIGASLLAASVMAALMSTAFAEVKTGELIRGIKVSCPAIKMASATYRRRSALCIGINSYSDYPRLECAAADAEAMAGAFKAYGFDDVTLITDSDAKRRKIINELLRSKALSHPDDLFVFYFAGHGQTVAQPDGEMGYLVPVDCSKGRELEDAISMEIIKDIADTMANRHLLFLVDACYSGYGLTRSTARADEAAPKGTEYVRAMLPLRSVQIITAGGKNEQAHEAGGHGVFTKHLLDCLTGVTPDAEDGLVTALELAARVKQEVVRSTNGRQNPNFGYLYGNGDVVFIASVRSDIAPRTEERETTEEAWSRLTLELKEMGRMYQAGNFREAERKMTGVYQTALALGNIPPDTRTNFLLALGHLSQRMGKNDLAIYYLNELHPDTTNHAVSASFHGIMGDAYLAKRDFESARRHYGQNLEHEEALFGAGHPKTAGSHLSIGSVSSEQGLYDRAIEEYRLCLATATDSNDQSDVIAQAQHNLGIVYLATERLDMAAKHFEKSLEVKMKAFPADHADMARTYTALGCVRDKQKAYGEAVNLHRKALEITLKALGPEHADVAECYNNLGVALKGNLQYTEALDCLTKGLAVWLKTLTAEHPRTAMCYRTIGLVLYDRGEYAKATIYFQNALAIQTALFGPEHRETAVSHMVLGRCYANQHQPDQAREHLRKALQTFTMLLGPGHNLTTETASNLRELGPQ